MKTNRWVIHLAGLVFLLGPCDEVLPPYSEPEVFLQGELSGLYSHVVTGNNLHTFFSITNIYDETLDDTVGIHGTVEIQSVRLPHIKRTFPFTATSLQSGTQYYNPITRRLTLDAGKSIVFRIPWNFVIDDRGVDPRKELFIFYMDPTCEGRCRAQQEDFLVSAEVYIFAERAPIKASIVFPVCYIYPYLGPPGCGVIFTDPPCVQPPSPAWPRCFPFG